jgi:hypothetical protein
MNAATVAASGDHSVLVPRSKSSRARRTPAAAAEGSLFQARVLLES